MLTHLRRELIQSVWTVILDDEFVDAYTHGILFEFQDGITRRIFPRIFTYSADYPEKYVVHNICFETAHLSLQNSSGLYQVLRETSVPPMSC